MFFNPVEETQHPTLLNRNMILLYGSKLLLPFSVGKVMGTFSSNLYSMILHH